MHEQEMNLTANETGVDARHVAFLAEIAPIKLARQEGALIQGVICIRLDFEEDQAIRRVILLAVAPLDIV